MTIESILILICIALLILIGYLFYQHNQLIKDGIDKLHDNHDALLKLNKELSGEILEQFGGLEKVISDSVVDETEKSIKKYLDYYFSETRKIDEGNKWLDQANNEDDESKKITLLEQGAKRFPSHKQIHSDLFDVLFNTLNEKSDLLVRKALLDKMIPLSQNFKEHATLDHIDYADEISEKTEKEAKELLEDLNRFKNNLSKQNLEKLSELNLKIENKLKEETIDSETVEKLTDEFKNLDQTIDKKNLSQDESLVESYRDISNTFINLLKEVVNLEEVFKRKEYNLSKLKDIEGVSKALEDNSESKNSFTDKMIKDYTKSIFIDRPELASDKLQQYAYRVYNELFSRATREQRMIMTEISINLEYE